MRSSLGFNASTIVAAAPGTTAEAAARGRGSAHSAWHSPVPYLFGGLAAMLGLIAFALLILACSYWKLSGFLENEGNSTEESSSKQEEPGEKPAAALYEERIVVIMAGEEKPRYLATPICSRASSFADNSSSSSISSPKSSSTSSDSGWSSSRDDGEVDGKKADDVVIGAEALESNMEVPSRTKNNSNQLNHRE